MKTELLYEETEKTVTKYISCASKVSRYDFALVYTQHFYGKTMVISLQSLSGCLLCAEDIDHEEYWVKQLDIASEDIPDMKEFLSSIMSQGGHRFTQY